MKKALLSIALLLLLCMLTSLASGKEATPQVLTGDESAIQEAVESFLQGEFSRLGQQTENGWQRFLYQQGVAEVVPTFKGFDIEKEKPLPVSFLLASGQPDVKTLDPYEGDASAWLGRMVAAMRQPDTKAKTSLLVAKHGTGYTVTFTPKAEAALEKTVNGLAAKAVKALQNKAILTALTDYLMPAPVSVSKKAPEALSPEEYTEAFDSYLQRNGLRLEDHALLPAALYALKGQKLDASEGPEQLQLTFTAPDIAALADSSSEAVIDILAYDENAKSYTSDEIQTMLLEALNKAAATHRHGKAKGETVAYTFNLLSLPEALHPDTFYQHNGGSLADISANTLENVRTAAWMLPDYPAVPHPKSGLVEGTSKGTQVIFKAYDDGYARSVCVYDANDTFVLSAFVQPGGSAKVRIPKGEYTFIFGVGDYWYGPDLLLGSYANYSKSIDTIPGSNYICTITLNVTFKGKEGNMSSSYFNYNDLMEMK